MDSLNKQILEYRRQLNKGSIQKAYKGIMTFMSALKSYLENSNPSYTSGALYFGYMDMTYFAFTPPDLKTKKLKIAVVYLHQAGRFEVWLCGNNRKSQAEVIKRLSAKDLGKYKLSQMSPGVDSIIESVLVKQPNFDEQEGLKGLIEEGTIEFINNVSAILTD